MNNYLQTMLGGGNSLTIRKLTEEDLNTRVLWMNNPAIYSSMHFDLPITLEKTMDWFYNNEGNEKRADMVVLEDGEIVAFCGITNIDPIIKKGEIYTFVNPEQKGKGYGTKARILLLNYAFTELGLNKVFSITNEDNVPSWKVNEKLGYTLEGRHRKEYLTKDGEWKDRLYYGLLKEEFMNM